jgi:molecular chaperone GrpE
MASLLSILDDIGRARDHGDLEGPFKAIAEALETRLEAAGLERYGARGDEFDPAVHEALMHSYRPDVTGPTCVDVFRAGYLHAGRVLRPAQVAVAEPAGEVDLGEPPAQAAQPVGDAAAAGEPRETADAPVSEPTRPTPSPPTAPPPPPTPPPNERPAPIPDDTGSVPRPDNGGPTVTAD